MKLTVIALNEARLLLLSPLPWLLFALVHFLEAMILFQMLAAYLEQESVWQGHGITEIVVSGTLRMAGLMLLLITPFLTMRLFSDGQRFGTLSLLLSAPVSITELVLGKYLGLQIVICGSLLLTTLTVASLWLGTTPDPGQIAAALLGLFLLQSTAGAIGLYCSTLSRQPAVAAAGAFTLLFLLWILGMIGAGAGRLAGGIGYLAILPHFSTLLSGIVDSADIVYFLLLSGCFLILSIGRLHALRAGR